MRKYCSLSVFIKKCISSVFVHLYYKRKLFHIKTDYFYLLQLIQLHYVGLTLSMIRILLLHVLLVTLAYGTQQNFAPQLIRLAGTSIMYYSLSTLTQSIEIYNSANGYSTQFYYFWYLLTLLFSDRTTLLFQHLMVHNRYAKESYWYATIKMQKKKQ